MLVLHVDTLAEKRYTCFELEQLLEFSHIS